MERNRWHGATRAASTMMLALLAATACEKKADQTMAADTMKAAAAPAAPTMPEAQVIDAAQLEKGAAALKGQKVRVNAATVASNLGTRAFWFSLPNKNPFLVVQGTDVTVKPQDVVDLVGTVQVMNDSTLKAWVTSGQITENQKLEAEFATEYIQAEAVQRSAGGAAAPADTTKAAPAK